jgi:transposase
MAMDTSPFLPLPDGLVLGQVKLDEAKLTVEVISTQPCARCPGCGTPSDAVHCQYQRTVQDVPCGGRTVVLRLRVRKFFCRVPTCSRKVFAERLPELVQPWARVSNRLLEEIKAIGLSASAEVSERLTPQLGMPVKAPTLLRYLRTIPDPPRTKVISLGIDDFALRRGDTYGTILINAETGKPLDLLANRTTEAVTPWLASHPEIQVVSRDRANGFAEAISQVLPHATQVADRYHLIHNLREHLQQLLDRKRTCLPVIKDTPVGAKEGSSDEKESSPAACPRAMPETDELAHMVAAERKKLISRNKQLARYEEVMALHRQGVPQREIARQLHLSRNTVRRYISSPGFPERAQGVRRWNARTNKLEPYLPYVREQWEAGNHNGAHLFRLIKARGYTGCESLLRMRLSEWRTELPTQRWPGIPRKPRLFTQKQQRRLSSRAASFLMIVPPEKLTAKQKQQLDQLCQASSDLLIAYHVSQDFVTLLKERQADTLHEWLKCAKASRIAELKSFANGIYRDYAAVYAACSRPESNGITEGHVNRLKFLKRQMFGRANLDLLRVKVLHAV